MQKLRYFAKYWLPVLAWMALIFTASGDVRSFQHSSRMIEPLLRFLFPHMADSTVREIVFGVRKLAHFTEYAVLAMLVLRAVRQPGVGSGKMTRTKGQGRPPLPLLRQKHFGGQACPLPLGGGEGDAAPTSLAREAVPITRPWMGRHARITVLVVALYAASDEWHQSFVPTRQASVVDVMIDTFGGTMGIVAVWAVGRWRRKW